MVRRSVQSLATPRRATRLVARLSLGAGLAMGGLAPALAQISAAEHASHHPDGGAAAVPPSAPSAAATPGPAGGMAGMMAPSAGAMGTSQSPTECCAAAGRKPFYASMLDFPKLTDDARKAIGREAAARLGSGSESVTTGQAKLRHALSTNDFATARGAISETREGLALAESGAGALQALNEGQAPRRIAMSWFKREMAIDQGTDTMAESGGLSWLHILAMALLAAALAAALLLRRARLRRIGALVERLTPGAASGGAPGVTAAAPLLPPAPGGGAPPIGSPVAMPTAVGGAPAPQRPWKGILRIKAIFDETATVKTFRLMEPNLGSIPFSFLPGQYATITSEIDGKKVRRSYTISSSPTQRDYIELTIKREEHGLESRHLHDHADTGDLVEIAAPSGRFFFTGREADGIVLIAGGVGITPMMSVLRDLTDRSYEHDIYLLYGVNTPADIIFREQIDFIARRHPKVHVAYTVSKTDGSDWSGPVGYITADFIAASVPDITRRRIHLCGPPLMMDAVKAALHQLDVPEEQIKTEDFAPPKGGPVLETEPATPETPPQTAAAAQTSPPASPIPSAHATVSFTISGKTGALLPDQSVLEAAEAIGVAIDYECRVGTCGRCKVPLRQGEVTMEVEDALAADEKASGIILACQAKSARDLIVEA